MYSDIFLSILSSFIFFLNTAQDLLNGSYNSRMGHNTQFETCCPRGLTVILLLGSVRGTTEQPRSANESSSKTDSKHPNGRAGCSAGPAEEASLDHT